MSEYCQVCDEPVNTVYDHVQYKDNLYHIVCYEHRNCETCKGGMMLHAN